jgi:DNA-binding MarR family transcriptional regulator
VYPEKLQNFLRSRRTPNRLHEVYALLECNRGWFSAEEINLKLGYVKRTLQGILNKLVEKKIVKKTRSLKDARITLFAAIPVEEIIVSH